MREPLTRVLDRLEAVSDRPMFHEFLRFGGSTLAVQATRVGAALVVAGMVGPAAWGTWYLLNLIVAYGSLTHLGALNGLNREVPAALGRGKPDEAVAIQTNALGMTLLGTGSVTAAFLLIVTVMPLPFSLLDVVLVLALLWGNQLFGFVSISLKSTTRFTALSRLQLLSSVVFPVLAIAGAWCAGLQGFIAGQVFVFTSVTFIGWRFVGIAFEPRLDWQRVRSLIRIGFPIMLVGLVYTLFTTVDRWVVTVFLGTESLGHYSLAIMAFGAVGLLPQVVAQQYYPRVAHAWAARADTAELRRLARQIRNMTLLVAAPVTAGAMLLLPPAVRALLPEYEPGISALMITVFAPIVGAFGQGYGSVLHMLNRQVWLLGGIVVAALVNLALSVSLVGPYGLAGVAIGSVVSFLVYALARVALGAIALRIEERH